MGVKVSDVGIMEDGRHRALSIRMVKLWTLLKRSEFRRNHSLGDTAQTPVLQCFLPTLFMDTVQARTSAAAASTAIYS